MAHNLTEGNVGKKLVLFALPIMAGMMLQTAYNIIDAIFIGILGPKELAAVSLTFPVVFVFIAVASGLGIGANTLIAQAFGRKNIGEANNFAEHALVIGTLIGVAIAALGIVFSPALFTLMGADAEVLALTIEYSVPIFVGMIFMFAWFVSDSILKAEGNSKAPTRNLAISVAANIVLDPILIFGLGPIPAMGLFGAAIATVIARVIAAGLNFAYIYSSNSALNLALRYFKPNWRCIKRMLQVGLPASASHSLTAGGFMLMTGVVGGFGAYAIAAFGVGLRVNSVVIMPMVGISMAMVSFVGQNVGAKNFDRAVRVSFLARRITLAIAIIIAAFVLAFPEQIMRAFSQDPNVIAIGVSYLAISPFAYILYGSYFALHGTFMGAGKTQFPLITNAAYWASAVAFAFFLSQTIGLRGVWVSFVIAAAIELVLVTGIFWSGVWIPKQKQVSQTN